MEVFASVLSVADVAARASLKMWRLCETWHDAPGDVQQLREELAHTNQFFDSVKRGLTTDHDSLVDSSGWPHESTRQLEQQLRHGQSVITEIHGLLDSLVEDGTVLQTDEAHRIWKIRWLKMLGKISKLRKTLRDTMLKICAILISVNVTISTKYQTSLQELESRFIQEIGRQVTDNGEHINAALDASSSKTASRIKEHLSDMHLTTAVDLHDGLENSHARYLTNVKSQAAQASKSISSQLLQKIETSESRITENIDRGFQKHRTEMISYFDQKSTSMQTNQAKAVEDLHPHQEQQIQRSAGLNTDLEHRSRSNPRSMSDPLVTFAHQAAWTYRQSPWKCQEGCQCMCHSLYRYSRWRLTSFSTVFGSLFLPSCSGPSRNFMCTDPRCDRQPSSSWVRLDYQLPDWLLAITLSLCMSNGIGGPELLLRVVRRIPRGLMLLPQSFYNYVTRGDIEGVKRLLQSGTVSVHDQWGFDGRTVLYNAMNRGDVNMARLLLQAGSDPFEESTVTRLLKWFHQGSGIGRALADLFPVATLLEDYSYTSLHKIVLGIQPLNLRIALQEPQFACQLNKRTLDGFTPIHLAACRGDTPAMRLMQAAGADVRSRALDQTTSLHYACLKDNPAAVQFLLMAGLDPNVTNILGQSPLHWAAELDISNTEVLALLIDAGADVNLPDNHGNTALFWAANFRASGALHYLIDRGADVNVQDRDGDIVLFKVIRRQVHQLVRLLLERGSDYTHINNYGWGILHRLAQYADEEMLGIFTDWGLKGIDADRRDAKGRTAGEMLEMREGVSLELRIKFHELLEGIRKAQAEAVDVEECGGDGAQEHESSDDEFYDVDEA